MKIKDLVIQRLAKTGYETMFPDKWDDLPKKSIERALWLKIADAMLAELRKAWEERG